MAVNKKLLQGAAAAAPGGLTPSEHFGVVLYEGDGKSGRSVNGGKYGAGVSFGIDKSTTQATDSRVTTTYYAKNVGSISGWLKKNGNTSELEYVFVTKDDTGSAHQVGINLLQESDSDLSARVGNGSSTTNVNTSGLTLNNDAWHHYVITWNLPNSTNNVKVYVDGSLQATGSQSTGSWTGNSSRTFQLGHYTNTNTNNGFAGMQDQVRVFEKELSSSEVSTLYAETAETVTSLDPLSEDTTDTLQVLGDSSCIATYRFENNEDDLSGNYDGTGTEVQYAAGRYGQAASFNGSGSRVDVSSISSFPSGNAARTISFWMYSDSYANGGIVAYGSAASNQAFAFYIGSSQLIMTFYAVNANINYALSTGQWYHVVATHDGTTFKAYINGSEEYSDTRTLNTGTAGFRIGGVPWNNSSEFFNGEIDQVRIFNKALSASEVTTLYNENSLVASYRFEGNSNDDRNNFNGTDNDITYEYGLNFTPDFVWIKKRDATENHRLYDSTRGVSSSTNTLYPSLNFAASTESPNGLASLDTGGFTVQNQNAVNSSGNDFVAWCLKANGGTTSSNTDGSITSTVQANQDAGFSIVTYTGTFAAATVGHGLSTAPEMIIVKNTGSTTNWWVWHTDLGGGTKYLKLNGSDAVGTVSSIWNSTVPTSTVFSVGNDSGSNGSGNEIIAYCFNSVDGFSKFGSYTGISSGDIIVETGFEPRFIMIKCTSHASTNWEILDSRRSPGMLSNGSAVRLRANDSSADAGFNNTPISFLSNGFRINSSVTANSYVDYDANGRTYMYIAFAADPDTEAPTVAKSFSTVTYTGDGQDGRAITGLGFSPSFVWFKERSSTSGHVLFDVVRGAGNQIVTNLSDAETSGTNRLQSFDNDGFTIGTSGAQNANGDTYVAWAWKADDNEPTIFSPSQTVADIKSTNITLNLNLAGGSYSGSGSAIEDLSSAEEDFTVTNATIPSGFGGYYIDFDGSGDYADSDSSIATTSGNDITIEFWIRPESATQTSYAMIMDANHSTAVSGSTGQGWCIQQTGSTNNSYYFVYYDGSTYQSNSDAQLFTLTNGVWSHIAIVKSGTSVQVYKDGSAGTSWTASNGNLANPNQKIRLGGWLAGGRDFNGNIAQVRLYSDALSSSQVTANYNATKGLFTTVESIVSANANAGFSIVKYEGNGTSSARVPHGLSSTPEMIIVKELDGTSSWQVHHTGLSANNVLLLNSTSAEANPSTDFNNGGLGTVNATTFGFVSGLTDTNNVNESGLSYIAYCFHSVSGFSKFGSYAGNGTTQTINVGFQPDFIMIKAYTNETTHTSWTIIDSVRYGSSSDTNPIYANLSAAEGTRGNGSGDGDVLEISFTSTGFKLGDTGSNNASDEMNDPNNDYIYWATKIN